MWRLRIDMELISATFAGGQHADEVDMTNRTICDREEAHRFLDRAMDALGVPEKDRK